ncbi:MAG: TIGR02300 family protein [Parvibaculaceae bacterium]
MVKPELGTKRACPSCHSRFYDLNRDPVVCPLCGTSFLPEALLPSKTDHAPAAPKPKPVEVQPEEAEEADVVSLEDVKADEDAADIEDVEIEGGEDEEDTFLEEEEEAEPGVSNLIGGKEDEEEA